MSTDRNRMILDLGRHASEQAQAAVLRAADLAGNNPADGYAIALVAAAVTVGAASGFLSLVAEEKGETTDPNALNIAVLDHLKDVLSECDPERLAAAARVAVRAR